MSKNSKKAPEVKPVEPDEDVPEVLDTIETPDMPDGAIPPVDVPGDYHEPTYRVPKGRALNCRCGIVAGGAEVTVEMVIGGLDTLEQLASAGGLVKE
jgi:hypothetical protein